MNDEVFERVVKALTIAESAGRHQTKKGELTTSIKGAQGITQVMPKTGRDPGYQVKPLQNDTKEEFLRFGRDYLKAMLREFGGDLEKALAAYNAGPGNVIRAMSKSQADGKHWKEHLPKPEETLPYIEKILKGAGLKGDKAGAIKPEATKVAQAAQEIPAEPTIPDDGYFPRFAKPRENIDWKSLQNDADWLDATEMVYRMYKGRPPQQDLKNDQELSEWGLQFMADLDWSLITLGRASFDIHDNADPETKAALVHMLDVFDNVDTSAAGVWRGAKAFATDPLNFAGLSTLGIGTVGKKATQQGAKMAFRQKLKQSAGRAGVVAAADGALFAGAENVIRQNLDIDLGRRESFSWLEAAGHTALGGVVGGTAGTVFDLAAGSIARQFRRVVGPKGTPGAAPDPVVIPGKGTAPAAAKDGGPVIEKLKGRRPQDAVHTMTSGRSLDEFGINIPAYKTGLRHTPQTIAVSRMIADGLAKSLKGLDSDEINVVVELLRKSELTGEEAKNLSTAVRIAVDDMKVERANLIRALHSNKLNGEALDKAWARKTELDLTLPPLEMADEAFSSNAGATLRQYRDSLHELRGVSPETIKANNPGLSHMDAEKAYADYVKKVEANRAADKVRADMAPALEAKAAAGDWKGVVEGLEAQRTAIAEAVHKVVGGNDPTDAVKRLGGFQQFGTDFTPSFSHKFNELAISNVFSATTLMINLVPSMVKVIVQPVMHAIMSNPLEKATRIEMAGNYAAMKMAFRGALGAAKASFKYEQSLLTRDASRLMEGELAMKGRVAGVVRTIPRALNATDEFLSHVAYNGYVGGKAAAQTYVEAIEKGMTKADALKAAKDGAKKAMDDAYKHHDIEARLKPIVNKGINLGLEGKKLDDWVLKEAAKNLKHIKHGTDKEALDYVRDILYKKQFDPNTMAGQAGQFLEGWMNKVPAIKWATGQLFFRTPIRVIEEGLRFTPGVQMLMPGYLADLAGRNGPRRQALAQGQAMLGYAFGAYAITAYAEGRITGMGSTDYRGNRLRQDSHLQDPYTIKGEDGSTWSYRMFDPISTPLKIIVGALEAADSLTIREAQGEFIDEGDWKKVSQTISSGIAVIVATIADANLFAGISNTTKLVTDLENAEGEHSKWVKAFGERLRWLIPNTAHKMLRTADPEVREAKTLGQVIQTQAWPIAPVVEKMTELKTSKSYDVLGNVRTVTDVGAMWNIFSTASEAERVKGRSNEELAVMAEMDRLHRTTGVTFTTPYKHTMLGDVDLRTVMTKDGSMTLFDAWNQKYRALNPVDALYPVAVAPLPDGTFESRGAKAQAMASIINQYRNAAFNQLLSEDPGVLERHLKGKIREGQSKAGLWDYGRATQAPAFEF